ncbi:MAG: TatD family hydrolase [Rhodocyclaceae bacterium]|nr:TatD family hydrolase [Rhodocyclaceae bacterium]MBP6109782.1 TatD family hydrolase [Rhodocyclaceae bacterium]MBP6279474.1 TatD family hydrolase [Rhodocyclaceae bacterium]
MIDTHCHLDAVEFDADRDAVFASAIEAGVSQIVVPSVERANFGAVASLCREHVQCRAAYGIHPMYVDRAQESDIEALRTMLKNEPAVAVGEIGLDRFVEPRDEIKQHFYFVEQLKIAKEFDLPVVLHVRRAVDAVLKELRRMKLRGGIAHAFNGSRQQADEFIKLGFVLGFGGALTFNRALHIRELAAQLPIESIVLETDAPDISPHWLNGSRNSPDQLPQISQTLADLRAVAVTEIISATNKNAIRALPRLAALH